MFHGGFSEDGGQLLGCLGPNPGADPEANLAYTIGGNRIA